MEIVRTTGYQQTRNPSRDGTTSNGLHCSCLGSRATCAHVQVLASLTTERSCAVDEDIGGTETSSPQTSWRLCNLSSSTSWRRWFVLYALRSALCSLHSLRSALCTLCALRSALCALLSALCSLCAALCALLSVRCALCGVWALCALCVICALWAL
jgi:hypothetical protein